MNQDPKIIGLTSREVDERVAKGQRNVSANLKTKSVGRIFYDNICTLFNLVNVVLFVSLLLVGSFKNLLFIGVVLCNVVIGIVQEIRSKKSVDKLTILSESKVKVLRDGEVISVSKEDLVLGDVVLLSRGSQIPADAQIIDGACKVNESLLTGESDLISKSVGDELLSGSFISAGSCYARLTKVGADCYAAKINAEAKFIKQNNSQILKSFRFVIRLCSIVIFPLGALLFISSYFWQHNPLNESVITTVGALVGMIPGGMILLTSSVLAVSVIRLSRQKVLINEMYCIETLARVDVLCLDKTGTLTTDEMTVNEVVPFSAGDDEINLALASIVATSPEINATLKAIADYAQTEMPLDCESFVPFSSETKWSGGNFSNSKSYVIGAAEFVFSDKEKYKEVFERIQKISDTVRIIVLAQSDSELSGGKLPGDLKPMALVLIKDRLRDNVGETLDYFKEQGVTLKVISGDSVHTVRNIAKDTGIEGYDRAVDMSTLKTDEEIDAAAESCNVFGRVTPAQKKKLVLALKAKGHTVAMTGDGVNDVLALKEADCSIAMASGSDAARNVSQLVLVNNDFAAMPGVVAEGRRTINNIERSSSLYLVKTIYSAVLSLIFIFLSMRYPFQPIQLTLISSLTVGFPSFILALQPNKNRVKGNFTFNILARAVPAALCVVLSVLLSAAVSKPFNISQPEISTMAVYLGCLSGFMLDFRLSYPLNALRTVMLSIILVGLIVSFIFFGKLFSLVFLSVPAIIILGILAIVIIFIFNILYDINEKFIINKRN